MRSASRFLAVAAAALLLSSAAFAAKKPKPPKSIPEKIRTELITLPFYSVFDNLTYEFDGTTAVLGGHVTRPTLRSGAEQVVSKIQGVQSVVNKIEVLPVSPNDDSIRVRAVQAIFGHVALNRYALGAQPPIRIIVKNGNLTLEGIVLSEGDKNIAGLQANSVSGVFSVTNNLRTEQVKEKK